MGNRSLKVATLLGLTGATFATGAQATDIWDGFREGDIIFQAAGQGLTEPPAGEEENPYTHVGIVRQTGGGPYVIDATPEDGVFEVPIDDFVRRGAGNRYIVYRLAGVEGAAEISARAIEIAFEKYYLLPFDPFYRRDRSAFYDSELVQTAFAEAGAELGAVATVRELGIETPGSGSPVFDDWQAHPDCAAAELEAEACWTLIRNQRVLTPASLASDPKLSRVYSNF
ncbi:YiiX/YebB-like N1pC/P60 family cysteine hydrolase [Amorphus sp. 3PC139-8]|uniref:YiiX/YebB-like N1pC/P60 family cysteine hydrolase n=1 Tax=Amorphus sp. 3PC139-8 TaxID=2735676 RepID=UPI00345D3B31